MLKTLLRLRRQRQVPALIDVDETSEFDDLHWSRNSDALPDAGIDLVLDRVYKSVGHGARTTIVFSDASCVFRHGWFTGVLGTRSSGKTTLINLLSGNAKPDAGHVQRPRLVSWPLSSREIFRKDISLRANIRFMSQMYGRFSPDMIDAVLEIAKIRRSELDKGLRELSNETHSRSVAALGYAMEFSCYVADGHLFQGSKEFRQYLFELFYERRERNTLIMTTRNLQTVRDFCDTCHVIDNGKIRSFEKKGDAIRAFKAMSGYRLMQVDSDDELNEEV